MHVRQRIHFLLFLLFIFSADVALGQTPADSTKIYKDIETYSKKRKFTKFLYRLVFRPTQSPVSKKIAKKKVPRQIQKPYSAFEGKIIRYIGIETLDPFGYSITDTIVSNQNFLSRSGNHLHIKSQRITIRNLLLIKQGQVFDSLLVKESERLVRSQIYIRDVLFYVVSTSKKSDSVDIFIRSLDKWSLIPNGSVSSSSLNFRLRDNNFVGLGHEFKSSYSWYHSVGDDAFSTSYYIPNIKTSYVNASLQYETDQYNNIEQGVTIDRPFYSPFAKWAGGVSISKINRIDSLSLNNEINVARRFKFLVHDYWLGHAFRIFKGNTENERTTNFIYTIRYGTLNYDAKPEPELDTIHSYANEQIYLSSIGISTRKYIKDKYIFGFGVTEDVPVGKVYSITGGYRERRNSGQVYLGARFAVGNYYSWGYFGTNLEYGTYLKSSKSNQGVVVAGINYFTNLFQVGNWKFRQFVKPLVTIGIKRLTTDSLTINDGFGLDGFNATALSGTNRILVTMQTQAYAPWSVIGFRFGPFFNYSMGMVGDASSGFKNSRVYSQIGLGVLIKNENLIISTFQLSISFFPLIPGKGNNVFKFNTFDTTDFGFRDFEIGKPAVVLFE